VSWLTTIKAFLVLAKLFPESGSQLREGGRRRGRRGRRMTGAVLVAILVATRRRRGGQRGGSALGKAGLKEGRIMSLSQSDEIFPSGFISALGLDDSAKFGDHRLEEALLLHEDVNGGELQGKGRKFGGDLGDRTGLPIETMLGDGLPLMPECVRRSRGNEVGLESLAEIFEGFGVCGGGLPGTIPDGGMPGEVKSGESCDLFRVLGGVKIHEGNIVVDSEHPIVKSDGGSVLTFTRVVMGFGRLE
jgi:hypothetical protein